MVKEIWKDIPSYRGFLQASNLGRIREYIIVKVKGYPDIIYKNRILKTRYSGDPYLKVTYNGVIRNAARLVAETWIKTFEKRMYVKYKDENFKNIKPENLDIGKSPGKSANGYNNWQAKLNDEKILEIIQMIKEHNTARTIANKYGIHVQNVYRIAGNKIWKHVTREVIYFKKVK